MINTLWVVLVSIHSGGHRTGSWGMSRASAGRWCGTQGRSGACVIEHPEMRKHRCFLRNTSSLVWLSSHGSALGKVGGRNKSQGSALFRNVDLILLCHLESLELLLCQNALFRCVVITWPVQRDVMWGSGGQRNKEKNHCFPLETRKREHKWDHH